jgi:hypothetical protein
VWTSSIPLNLLHQLNIGDFFAGCSITLRRDFPLRCVIDQVLARFIPNAENREAEDEIYDEGLKDFADVIVHGPIEEELIFRKALQEGILSPLVAWGMRRLSLSSDPNSNTAKA